MQSNGENSKNGNNAGTPWVANRYIERQQSARPRTSPSMKSSVLLRTVLVLIAVSLTGGIARADWPTYQHDSSRSGSTSENAPKDPVHAWMYQSPMRPTPAWDEPALWDGYSKTHDLKNRQVFDKVFHVVESNGRCLLYTSPSPRDLSTSRMPSSA